MNVALFVTCLVDLMRPQIGLAAIKLLEQAIVKQAQLKQTQFKIMVPPQQTCCGQPAYNSGARQAAKKLAQQMIRQFETFDYIVVPSGSCTGMIRKDYPELFEDDEVMLAKAKYISEHTYELVEFLSEICHFNVDATLKDKKVTYHSSCSSLRSVGLEDQPQKMLTQVKGCHVIPLPEANVCCGFGGTFCVKFSEISNKMVSDKVRNVMKTEADILTSVDLGCLMNIIGKLHKAYGNKVKGLHIAEILANQGEEPGIGDNEVT